MARRDRDNAAATALEEIEELGDRLVDWVSANPVPVLVGLGLILAAAAGIGGTLQYRASREDAASAALEEVRAAYREAMGAQPGVIEIPEPANPETAHAIRKEYASKFRAVAEKYSGLAAAPLAWLEVGDLQLANGDRDAAITTWRAASEQTDPQSPARALLLDRVAGAEEDAGNWKEAAQAYQAAGQVERFPLRYLALAHAARAWAEAGDADRALELFTRIQAESPETQIPEHIAAPLRELEARSHAHAPSPGS